MSTDENMSLESIADEQANKVSASSPEQILAERTKAEAEARKILQKSKEDLQRMYAELKKTLKPMSKNELIRMVGACLVDNYVLKTELQRLNGVLNAQISIQPGGHAGIGSPGTSTNPAERTSESEQQ